MNELSHCPSCGQNIPSNAPAGLCPNCLLQAGLPAADPGPTVTPLSANRFQPPTPQALTIALPQFQVDELIGCGGMGAVYRAQQVKLGRLIALKVLRPTDDPAFAERFHREARTLARMSHPNIVAIHDFGEFVFTDHTGRQTTLFYFVMEYVPGNDLRKLMGSPMPPDHAYPLIAQTCSGLQYAHELGIVHRDIKPENILIDDRGNVKIADFGLAKLSTSQEPQYTLTGTHQVMGTPRYMAPEQMEGSRHVDHRADVYSLGIVFYELLTGQIPMGQFDPPSVLVENVGQHIDKVILTAIAREPDRRQQSAAEIVAQLADSPSLDDAPQYPMGASTIFDLGLQKAVNGLKRTVNPKPMFTKSMLALTIFLLAIFGTLLQVGEVTSSIQRAVDTEGQAIKLIFAFLLCSPALFLIVFGGLNRTAIWRPFLTVPICVAAVVLGIINNVAYPTYSQGFRGLKSEFEWLGQMPLLATIIAAIMLILALRDMRNQIAQFRARPKKRPHIPDTAHVGFHLPSGISAVSHIAPHFQMLGYQQVSQSPSEWIFERGVNSGHWKVDIRKCLTHLTVRTGSRPNGGQWISCTWAVQGFVANSEIPKLEAEGQALARAMGVDTVTLTKSQSKSVQPSQNIVGILGGSSRSGQWVPSAVSNVVAILGGCEVDFRNAILTPQTTYRVYALGILGAAEIIVPPSVEVEITGIGILGSFGHESKSRRATSTDKTGPKIVLSGLGLLGAVSVETKD